MGAVPTPLTTVEEVAASDPVGVKEIAERLGVPRGTVAVWHHRGLMPKPKWEVSGGPAWRWSDIEKWARKSGRLKEEPK